MATAISGGQTQHGRIRRISQTQEGRQEGERTVLERLLQRRFGVLTPEITEKLSEASSTELENWAENVLDAENA